MKKELIKEAFRLQQIAGLLKENDDLNMLQSSYLDEVDKITQKLAQAYMKEDGIDEDEALSNAASEIIEYLEQMYTQYMEESAAGLQQEAYIENMWPDLQEAMTLLKRAWNHIKNDPDKDDNGIALERESILSHIKDILD